MFESFRYDEQTQSLWRPRHPFVAYNDIVLTVFALISIGLVHEWYTKAYFLIVAFMFAASALYHTLQYAVWHHRLDRAMIYLLISGTVLPYWSQIYDSGRAHGVYVLIGLTTFGLCFKLFGIAAKKGRMSTLLYTGLGLVSVYTLMPAQYELGYVWSIWMWSGVFLYALQMISYNQQWFDWFPAVYGYREAQHSVLFAAVMIHSALVFLYVAHPHTSL